MNVRILAEAQEDLASGFRFYEAQVAGLGSYFIDSLYSDIDSLQFFGGIHLVVADDYSDCCQNAFHLPSTISGKARR